MGLVGKNESEFVVVPRRGNRADRRGLEEESNSPESDSVGHEEAGNINNYYNPGNSDWAANPGFSSRDDGYEEDDLQVQCPPHTTQRKLVSKIDLRVIPVLSLLYLLAVSHATPCDPLPTTQTNTSISFSIVPT